MTGMDDMTAAMRPQGGGQQGHGGILGNPGLLAAGAAGLVSAICALWAFRGLPLGTPVLWLAPLPLFLAGLGFGLGSAAIAAALGTILVLLMSAGSLPALAYLALFGVPVPLMVAGALRGATPGGALSLTGPLLVLGAWPVLVLVLAAASVGGEGGLDAAMRRAVETALERMGLPATDALVGTMVRVKAAALGFWAALVLVATGTAAQRVLARRGLARAATPDWAAAARLPRWYPVLPGIAGALLLLTAEGADAVPLSALLLLLVPLFFLGLAGVHARARSLGGGRLPMLIGFYVLLVLFLQMMGPALVGLGLVDHFRRRGGATPSKT